MLGEEVGSAHPTKTSTTKRKFAMQPTTPTPPPTPAPPVLEPVIELIRTQQQNVGYTLLGAAVVFLALTGWLALKTSRIAASTTPDATKGAKDKDSDPFKSVKLDGTEIAQPDRVEYIVGAVNTFAVFVAFAAVGGFLLAAPAKPKIEDQRTQARLAVLVLGSAVGAALIAAGAFYFYQWNGSLVKWLDQGELSEAKWIGGPLMVVVLGGALMFVSAQPARAEERNNAGVRQFIYGSNFGLTVLMLFVVLIIANVVVALRVPNKLDTTSTGFYTLNPQTKLLVEGLDQPLHAYAIFQDSGDAVTEDTKQLLSKCQDANPGKFRATFLSPGLNKDAIIKLRSDYPLAELSGEGILLVAGDETGSERKRHSFIRDDELRERKEDSEGRAIPAFNGEPRLLRELMFLAENKQKPKVYFTQASGELSLTGGGRGPAGRADPRRGATGLKAYLEKNYFDVQPLVFDSAAPAKVPDDAAVVVVADPTAPIPPNGIKALEEFMNKPRADGKTKGKLIVLAGAQAGTDNKALQTGLEPILQTFGVRLSDRFLYASPSPALDQVDRARGIRTVQVGIAIEAVKARNPVALGFNKLDRVEMVDCRELTSSPIGGFESTTVLLSLPDRLTWQTRKQMHPADAWKELAERIETIRNSSAPREERMKMQQTLSTELDMSDQSRELSAFVSEGKTARVAVFGCGWFVSDDAGAQATGRFGDRGATVWLDLMGSTLDWVRDKPTVTGVTEKPYTTYQLKPGYDTLRMVWVPLALAVLIIAGFGAGVWVIRRK